MTSCNLPLMPPNSSIGTISGFSILPVQYDHATYHMLLPHPRKKLRRSTGQKARAQAMFMVNVPLHTTEHQIVLLFKSCRTVEKVLFDANETSKDANSDSDSNSDSDNAENNSESDASSPS